MSTDASSGRVIRFGAFELDVRAGELRKRGVRLPIQGLPLQILAILADHSGEVVTREELRSLWSADTFVDFDHSIRNAVARLRDALGDAADTPRYIETLPRRGYRFIGQIEGFNRQTADPDSERHRAVPDRRWVRGLAIGIIATMAVATVASVAYWRGHLQPTRTQIESIAVLPLDNLSGDPSQDYLADGIGDALTTDLAGIRSLRVISRTSAVHYRGTHQALPEIARELHVDAILEGAVTRSGDKVRITVQLIQAQTDFHLWAGTYEKDSHDLLALQREVAQAVAKQVLVSITPEEQGRLTRPAKHDPEAYDDYVRGRYFEGKNTAADFKTSILYFRKAIDRDPAFAAAYVGLGEAYGQLADLGVIPQDVGYVQMKAATAKALDLDHSLAEAHESLGFYHLYHDWNERDAKQDFERAIAVKPSYADAHEGYAMCLLHEGHGDEAIVEMKKAYELDPLNAEFALNLGKTLYFARHYDEAIAEFQRDLLLYPDRPDLHYGLGWAYLHTGRLFEAEAQFMKVKLLTGLPNAGLGYVYAQAGRRKEAETMLRALLDEASKQEGAYAASVAALYVGLGRKDEAFRWLERAYHDRSDAMLTLAEDPGMDPIRQESRFADLVRRVNLLGQAEVRN